MFAVPMGTVMRYRHLLLMTGLLSAAVAAQGVAPSPAASDRWTSPKPAPAASSGSTYHDALSTAAGEAQRFNFSGQNPPDKAPPDQSPIRVIINNGHGPNINCAPMGAGTCH